MVSLVCANFSPLRESSSSSSSGMVVHVASMPLRAPPGPATWALWSADRLFSAQHFYTILQPIPASPLEKRPCTAFDFQPQNPEDLYTVIVGLSGGLVPGVILERTIRHPPARRCWKVGTAKDGISMKDAAEFNMNWDCNLQLWKHDCRHHTDVGSEWMCCQAVGGKSPQELEIRAMNAAVCDKIWA